jgi:hypothetical protein
MWNRNNPYQYSDPTGYDPLVLLPPVSHVPVGIDPLIVNIWSKHFNDVAWDAFGLPNIVPLAGGGALGGGYIGMKGGLTGVALAKMIGKGILGGFVAGYLAQAAWTIMTDKGIAAGYYVHTVFKDNGSATTYAVYKPPEGSKGGFIQVVEFDQFGNWKSRTVFDDGKVLNESGFGSGRHMVWDQPTYSVPAGVGATG